MNYKRLAAVAILTCLLHTAHAVPIVAVAGPTDSLVGSTIEIDVGVSALEGELIGDYDVTLTYDPAVLGLASVAFGTFLDGPILSFQEVIPGSNSVNVAELSVGGLLAQDGVMPFTLFAVTFDVIGTGVSPLDLVVNQLGGFFGLPVDYVATGGSFFATAAPPASVPAPGTLALLAAGLLAAVIARVKARPDCCG